MGFPLTPREHRVRLERDATACDSSQSRVHGNGEHADGACCGTRDFSSGEGSRLLDASVGHPDAEASVLRLVDRLVRQWLDASCRETHEIGKPDSVHQWRCESWTSSSPSSIFAEFVHLLPHST